MKLDTRALAKAYRLAIAGMGPKKRASTGLSFCLVLPNSSVPIFHFKSTGRLGVSTISNIHRDEIWTKDTLVLWFSAKDLFAEIKPSSVTSLEFVGEADGCADFVINRRFPACCSCTRSNIVTPGLWSFDNPDLHIEHDLNWPELYKFVKGSKYSSHRNMSFLYHPDRRKSGIMFTNGCAAYFPKAKIQTITKAGKGEFAIGEDDLDHVAAISKKTPLHKMDFIHSGGGIVLSIGDTQMLMTKHDVLGHAKEIIPPAKSDLKVAIRNVDDHLISGIRMASALDRLLLIRKNKAHIVVDGWKIESPLRSKADIDMPCWSVVELLNFLKRPDKIFVKKSPDQFTQKFYMDHPTYTIIGINNVND